MRLILVRCAETDTNAALRYHGQAAVPLNARGRRQAEQTAQRLVKIGATALYTSELVRAVETAAIIGAHVKLRPEPAAALREIDLGEWEALTPEALYRRFPDTIKEFARNPDRPVRSGGESYAQLQRRVDTLLAEWSRAGDATIVAITHGGVIRTVLRTVIGLELGQFSHLALDSCGLSEFQHGPPGWRLRYLNDTAHL